MSNGDGSGWFGQALCEAHAQRTQREIETVESQRETIDAATRERASRIVEAIDTRCRRPCCSWAVRRRLVSWELAEDAFQHVLLRIFAESCNTPGVWDAAPVKNVFWIMRSAIGDLVAQEEAKKRSGTGERMLLGKVDHALWRERHRRPAELLNILDACIDLSPVQRKVYAALVELVDEGADVLGHSAGGRGVGQGKRSTYLGDLARKVGRSPGAVAQALTDVRKRFKTAAAASGYRMPDGRSLLGGLSHVREVA